MGSHVSPLSQFIVPHNCRFVRLTHIMIEKLIPIMLFTSKFCSPIGSIRFVSTADNLKQVILPTQSLSARLSHDLESKEIPLLLNAPSSWRTIFRKAEGIFFTFGARRHAISGQSMDGLVQYQLWRDSDIWATSKVVGVPNGARPVGSANALNPLPIILPCHRYRFRR